jgi:hypothetical protein
VIISHAWLQLKLDRVRRRASQKIKGKSGRNTEVHIQRENKHPNHGRKIHNLSFAPIIGCRVFESRGDKKRFQRRQVPLLSKGIDRMDRQDACKTGNLATGASASFHGFLSGKDTPPRDLWAPFFDIKASISLYVSSQRNPHFSRAAPRLRLHVQTSVNPSTSRRTSTACNPSV